MSTSVFFTPDQVEPPMVAERTAVVIDVIRATSTIVTALASGARAVHPTVSTEDALKLAASLGRDQSLLCGERKGLKVDGFDLGNSPAEYTPDVVDGMHLVMSTTNGTRAFHAASAADRVVAASFLNLDAAARAVADDDALVVVCAGKEGRFSLDDAVCAGYLLERIRVARGGAPDDTQDGALDLDDAALACVTLAGHYGPDADFLASTAAGRALLDVGLGEDLETCADVDRYDLAPELQERMIRIC